MIFYVLNCNYYYFLCVFFYSLGNYPRIVVIDRLRDHLTSLAFAESTRKNMQSHLNAYLSFCNNFIFRSFPLNVIVVSRYVSYLAHVGRRFGTIQNHISSLKHFHQVYGFSSGWEQQYFFRLIIKGTKRYLGMQATRKKAITPLMLHRMAFFFDLRIPLHAAMWALFLVAFFSFLRNSNLVVKNMRSVSSVKVLRCSHLILNENTAFLRILATKTIQFAQRSLNIPLPVIPGSILCPVAALHTHLKLNQVPASAPLFSVRASDSESVQAITYPQFSRFLARSLQAIGADPSEFSPHSFRRGGATFAFDCGLPAELIKLQGDWRSDAYLVYLEMTDHQKRTAVNAMAHALQQIGL